jgi:hypothetical protein
MVSKATHRAWVSSPSTTMISRVDGGVEERPGWKKSGPEGYSHEVGVEDPA